MPVDSPPILPTPQKLQKKIDSLRAKSYLPAALVDVVSCVALVQSTASDTLTKADHTLSATLQKRITSTNAHAQGACLLPREYFPLRSAGVKKLASAILDALGKDEHTLAPQAKALCAALKAKEYSLTDACTAVLKDDSAYFSPWEKAHPEAPGFFRFVTQSAIMPFAAAIASTLAQSHTTPTPWVHGHCPLCGSQPLMGQLAEAQGTRMHSCSFCSFEFRVPRIGCPFCNTDNPQSAEYYASEDEAGFQLEVCKTCRNYIKIADFRQLDRISIPVLDDLESLTLDLHARQMGYTRPTLSAWGF